MKSLDQFSSGEHFEKSADWQAAAADRIPFPRHNKLRQSLGDLRSYPHPLGGAFLAKGENFASIDEALETSQKSRPFLLNSEDARASFICAWRFWRNWAASIDSRFVSLPADTRIPDHSIWHHLSVTSAFQGAIPSEEQKKRFPGENLRPRLLLFSIGPVQDFIAAARSTRDLWSGSYLLSYLVSTVLGQIAKDLGPDHVIFPNLIDQPLIDQQLSKAVYDDCTFDDRPISDGFGYKDPRKNLCKLLTPSLPNRFLALVPARIPGSDQRIQDYADGLVKDIKDRLSDIADKVREHMSENQDDQSITFDSNAFDTQVKRLLEVHWQTLPIPESIKEPKLESIKELKRIGDQLLPDDSEELGYTPRKSIDAIITMAEKCEPQYPTNTTAGWGLLNALIACLHDGVKSHRSFDAWRPGRWESGKRFNRDSLNGREEAVLQVTSGDEEAVAAFCKNKLKMSKGTLKPGEQLGASSLIKRLWHHIFLPKDFGISLDDLRNGNPMPNTRDIAAGQLIDNSDEEADTEALKELPLRGKYFAVLALDGDQMGKWISGSKSPSMGHGLSPKAIDYYQKHCPKYLDAPRAITPSWHLQFSEALGNFSFHAVQRIIEAFDGRLIYSGGDDVLAMLPGKDALACARALRAAFRGEMDHLNQICGVLTGHGKERRSDRETRLFDVKEDGYLRLHKDSGARYGDAAPLLSDPVTFPALVPGPHTDVSVGIALAHFKAPLQDVVKAAQAAEKLAKRSPRNGGLDRGAVAISLFKRSGEILKWGTKWSVEEVLEREQNGLPKKTRPTSNESAGYTLLLQLVKDLGARKLNARFPHKLEAQLNPYLPDSDSIQTDPEFEKCFAEIIRKEIVHCLSRNDGGQLGVEAITLFTRYWEELDVTPDIKFGAKLTRFINLLRTAAWINRAADEKKRPADTKTEPLLATTS